MKDNILSKIFINIVNENEFTFLWLSKDIWLFFGGGGIDDSDLSLFNEQTH